MILKQKRMLVCSNIETYFEKKNIGTNKNGLVVWEATVSNIL